MNKKLKTGLFGFSKKETMDYIESCQSEYCEKINAFDSEINKLKSENENLRKVNIELTNGISALKAELERIKKQLEDKCKKTAENENVKNRVGEIFIEAREHADSIILGAKETADNIKTTAIRQAKSTVSDIDATYCKLEQLRNNVKSVFSDFCDRVDNIKSILSSAKVNIDPDILSDKTEDKIKYL